MGDRPLRLRIAFVIIDCDGRNGTSKAIEAIMHRMARRGHEVHLYADVASGADHALVHWHRVRALPDPAAARLISFYLNCTHRIRRVRRKNPYDIVHSAGCYTGGADIYQIQNVEPAKRKILEEHGQFVGGGAMRTFARRVHSDVSSYIEASLYKIVSDKRFGSAGKRIHFLPVSGGIAKELCHFYPLTSEDLTIIPNGVELEQFHPRLRIAVRATVKAQLGLAPETPMLLFVGGEWRRKGLQHAIEALPHLQGNPKLQNARLVVVGYDATQNEFEKLARRLGVEDRVVFAGFTDRPEDFYAAADVFVFPTYYEAFSLATLEAAACGLPILAGVTNGTEELVRPGSPGQPPGNGALVERNGLAIAQAIASHADQPDGFATAGAESRKIVEQDYGWDAITDRIEAVYQKIALAHAS